MTLKLRTMLLRWALYGLGVLSLAAFCVTKSPRAMQRMTIGSSCYGDLYHFAKIRRFKPAQPLYSDAELLLPPAPDSVLTNSIDAIPCRTFLFGDSFSSVRFEKTALREALGQHLGAPVYFVSKQQHGDYYRKPLLFFAEHPMDTNEQRTLILEMVERYISSAFALAPEKTPHAGTPYAATPAKEPSWIEKAGSMPVAFVSRSERNHEFLLKNSSVTLPLVETWNSFVFAAFRKTPTEVPVYSLTPPMLFFHEETEPALNTSFYARHDDELITRVSQNIAILASELSRQHRVRLVFVPVPNKFTVYSRLVTRDFYDEFIPRLVEALDRQGVTAVNLLPAFRGQREMLYQLADTHWNARGIRLAAPLIAHGCEYQGSGLELSGAAQTLPGE